MDTQISTPTTSVFYGWIMVVLAFITGAVGVGQTYLNGILIVSLRERFEISNEAIFMATTGVMMLAFGVSATVFGILVSKLALSWVAVTIFVAMAAGYVLLSLVTELWQVAAVYGLLFGVGQLAWPVSQTMVTRWFVAKRGLAWGIASCGFAMPGFIVAPLMTYMIGRIGFSATMLAYAALIALFIPVVLRFVVDWPERMGLAPDGAPVDQARSAAAAEAATPVSAGQIVRQPLFWLVALIVTLAPMIIGQIMTYVVPMARDSGMEMQLASFFMSGLALAALVAKPVIGWIADRIPLKLLTMIAPAGYIVSCLLFLNQGSSLSFGVAAFVAGASGAASAVMIVFVMAKAFGRGAFGTVAGLTTPLVVAFSLIATWAAGRFVDLHGNYDVVLWGFIGLSVLCAALSLLLPSEPRERTA